MSADGVTEPDKRTPEMKIQFSASGQPPNQADRPHRAVVTGQVQMHATLARPADPSRHREQQSMNILIMGDFTGRACAGDEVDHVSIAERPLIRIDIDNLEKVMANCSPRAIVQAGPRFRFAGQTMTLMPYRKSAGRSRPSRRKTNRLYPA